MSESGHFETELARSPVDFTSGQLWEQTRIQPMGASAVSAMSHHLRLITPVLLLLLDADWQRE
jgi:hypothetical protein